MKLRGTSPCAAPAAPRPGAAPTRGTKLTPRRQPERFERSTLPTAHERNIETEQLAVQRTVGCEQCEIAPRVVVDHAEATGDANAAIVIHGDRAHDRPGSTEARRERFIDAAAGTQAAHRRGLGAPIQKGPAADESVSVGRDRQGVGHGAAHHIEARIAVAVGEMALDAEVFVRAGVGMGDGAVDIQSEHALPRTSLTRVNSPPISTRPSASIAIASTGSSTWVATPSRRSWATRVGDDSPHAAIESRRRSQRVLTVSARSRR
jgi:hypothetical protein